MCFRVLVNPCFAVWFLVYFQVLQLLSCVCQCSVHTCVIIVVVRDCSIFRPYAFAFKITVYSPGLLFICIMVGQDSNLMTPLTKPFTGGFVLGVCL